MPHCIFIILLLYFKYTLYWITFSAKAASLHKMCTLCYVPIEKVHFVLSAQGCVELIQIKIQLPNAGLL
jgi:hypothetical protein